MNCTDPKAWMWFSEAVTAVEGDPDRSSGIGIALPRTDIQGYNSFVPLMAVDIDWKRCVDAQPGKFPNHMMNLISTLDSYTEFSPSMMGAHVLVAAKLSGTKGVRKHTWPDGSEVSLMQYGAYATFTGHRLPESGTIIQYRQPGIDRIFAEWFPDDAAEIGNGDGLALSGRTDGEPTRRSELSIDRSARASDQEISQLIQGVNRSADQIQRMAATWEMRRTPGVPNAEFVFQGDHSVSMYLRSIVREVVFLAPAIGWKDPDQMAATLRSLSCTSITSPLKRSLLPDSPPGWPRRANIGNEPGTLHQVRANLST